ncbi:hypothetical protein COCON_G00090370 [Conger conger]|uniref:Uncharacterized protein n=1 Tax=Conger conger TaxID=82655 RepID=A0A9Q1DKU2_CONCO|nr:hypothetical protein COCON_G00090370 [Conger conger]
MSAPGSLFSCLSQWSCFLCSDIAPLGHPDISLLSIRPVFAGQELLSRRLLPGLGADIVEPLVGGGALVATGPVWISPRLAPQVAVAKTGLFAGREAAYDSEAPRNLSALLVC